MVISGTTSKIEALLSGAVATNNLPFMASWTETTSTTATVNRTVDNLTGVSAVTVVGSPGAASTKRELLSFSVYNADTADATVTVRYYNGTSNFTLRQVTLRPGEMLQWDFTTGWSVSDTTASKREGVSPIVLPRRRVLFMHQQPTNIGSVGRTLSGNGPVAVLMGRAGEAYTQATVGFAIRTGGTSITWGEVAIATGASGLFAPKTLLTVRGYVDASVEFGPTAGSRKVTVPLSGIVPGQELWVVFGAAVTGTNVSLEGQAAEAFGSGMQLITLSRPSTVVGKQEECTINAGISPWCSAVFS